MAVRPTVAKHRYFSGKRAKLATRQYTSYLTYRRGEDREKGGRLFFGASRDDVTGREVQERLAEFNPGRGVMAHELILSPGLNVVDPRHYTRELMEKMERSQGRELEWVAVAHKGEHSHIHVLILGKDERGRPVRIDRNDHKDLRRWGDRYLEREHTLDRVLEQGREKFEREQELEHQRQLRERRAIDRDFGWEPDRGDDLFNRLFANPEADRERQVEPEPRPVRQWDRERAIAELDDKEKIYRKQEAFTRFSSLDELKRLDAELRAGTVERVDKAEYAQLRQWIQEKEKFGDGYHDRQEEQRFVQAEISKEQESQQYVRQFQEVDAAFRKRWYERDDSKLPKGKMQQMFEERGRLDDEHARYARNMEEKRLADLMEADPDNRQRYEQQLQELRQESRPQPGQPSVMPESQRLLEEQGRLSDAHELYTRNMEEKRLTDLMNADPENKQRYEEQLEQLRQSFRGERAPELEKADNVIYLFGWADKDRADDRHQHQSEHKERTDDEERSGEPPEQQSEPVPEPPDQEQDDRQHEQRLRREQKEREEREEEERERARRESNDRDGRGGR